MTLYAMLMQTREQSQQPIPEPRPFVLTDDQCAAVDDQSEPEKQA